RGAVLLEDFRARDVRGHQVRRELDPAEPQVQCTRQGRDQQRLRQPGHTDQQRMAVRKKRDQQPLDDGMLPDHAPPDLRLQRPTHRGKLIEQLDVLVPEIARRRRFHDASPPRAYRTSNGIAIWMGWLLLTSRATASY